MIDPLINAFVLFSFLSIPYLLLPTHSVAGLYWFCPLSNTFLSSSSSSWSAYGSSLLAEKYNRGVDFVQRLEVPPIGAYVSEAGSKAGEKIVLIGASALNALSWLRLPNFNWTWVGGERTVNNFFTSGSAESTTTVKERVTVVHDWSKADLSGLRDELRQELKVYVDRLMGEKERQREKRSLSAEEVDNVLNLLLDKLKAGDYFKLDLTEENFRMIFMDMRTRFLEDNQVFMSQLMKSVQGSLDLSAWDEKLKELRMEILGTRDDLSTLVGDVDRMKREMVREEDLQSLKESLMAYINEMIKQKVTEVVSIHWMSLKEAGTNKIEGSLANEDEVRRLIVGALKVYDADKTGLSDYALESAGGQVLSTRCTENYHTKSAQISIFGLPLWYPSNTPRTAIQPNVLPGNCWAFQGFPGFLGELQMFDSGEDFIQFLYHFLFALTVLQLNIDIFVTGFTMEHIPKSLSNGKIESAPKIFSVWVSFKNGGDIESSLIQYI